MEQLLTPDEVSTLLGVPTKTLAHWRSQRTGPLFIRAGVYVRYRRIDLDSWIEDRLEDTRRWMAS